MVSIGPGGYRIATNFLYPAAAMWTLRTACRARDKRYARERLSGRWTRSPQGTPAPIWLHCASVGELNTAEPLVRAWLTRHPNERFVVTTNTETGAAVFTQKHFGTQVKHRYMPLDYSPHCTRFIAALAPKAAWIMETELWLNMFSSCAKYDIPISIINARLSAKTTRAAEHPYMRDYYHHCLRLVTRVLARDEDEAEKYSRYGATENTVRVTGNLKYAVMAETDYPNPIKRPYYLAASTHADEELMIAQAFRGKTENLLVIVPRHPHRGHAIARQLRQLGFKVARRSAGEDFADTDIYIADTIGELPSFIAHARLVFMGGTLTPIGGHNVLEPAMLDTPQIVGPHAGNHANEIRALRAANAIQQITSAEELTAIFRQADHKEYDKYAQMAQRAQAFLRTQQTTVVSNYMNALGAQEP